MYESEPLSASVGASLTAVTLMVLVTPTLDVVPSLPIQVTVRVSVLGLSELLLYRTLRSAVW